jgi:hypothetical protein
MKMTFVLLLILLTVLPAAAQEDNPWVTLDYPKIDFGYVPEFGEAFHHFWIRSKIKDTLYIGESKTFCDCLEFTFLDSTLAPGDSIRGVVSLSPSRLVGEQHWQPAIYARSPRARIAKVDVTATIFSNPKPLKPVQVEPMVINASWFGDQGPREFKATLINTSDATIPLRLVEADTTYYNFDFPVFLEPRQKKEIKIVLNDRGLQDDFKESIIFEYIDNKNSERKNYTIPVQRTIFRK